MVRIVYFFCLAYCYD